MLFRSHNPRKLQNPEFDIEFGGEAPSGNIYAGVMQDGEFWILEFPWIMYRDISAYLPLKPGG